MQNMKSTNEVLDHCVLMGRAFMLTKKAQSIPLPEGYLCSEQGITLESVRDFGGQQLDFGKPKFHKKYTYFYCYRASLQGPILYYFCVRYAKGLKQSATPKIYIFKESDLIDRCIHDQEPVHAPNLEVTAHSMGQMH